MLHKLAVLLALGQSMKHILLGLLYVTNPCPETGEICLTKKREGMGNVQHMCQFNWTIELL
jgi:hypothetical protein